MANPAAGAALREAAAKYSGWHWLNADPEIGDRSPQPPRLGEIGVPTLVIVGNRDGPGFQRNAALAAGIAGARYAVLDGIGHVPNMEASAQFNDALLRFLADVAPTNGRRADV